MGARMFAFQHYICDVPEAEPTHSLIREILSVINAHHPHATIYDIFRLPGYKPWGDHDESTDRVTELLLSPQGHQYPESGCECVSRRSTACNAIIDAWDTHLISPNFKDNYDNDNGQDGYLGPAPLVGVPPPPNNPPLCVSRDPAWVNNYPYSFWDPEINRVQGTAMSFGIVKPVLFCRKIQNTFWKSISLSMRQNEDFWAEIKAGTNKYYSSVVANEDHPRYNYYRSFDLAAVARHTTLQLQLDPDTGPNPPYAVTPDLWQVVADAWKIELIVFYEHMVVGRLKRKRVLTRGSHNATQIFLMVRADGEYVSLAPKVEDVSHWRYNFHYPAGKLTAAKRREISLIRSPFVVLNNDWVPNDPPHGIWNWEEDRISEAPFPIPDSVIDPPDAAIATAAETLAYLNTGQHC